MNNLHCLLLQTPCLGTSVLDTVCLARSDSIPVSGKSVPVPRHSHSSSSPHHSHTPPHTTRREGHTNDYTAGKQTLKTIW